MTRINASLHSWYFSLNNWRNVVVFLSDIPSTSDDIVNSCWKVLFRWYLGLETMPTQRVLIRWTLAVRMYMKLYMVWFGGISTIVVYLMPNQFLYIKTVLFQTIQFSISTPFSCIWPIDRTLSSATTSGQSGRGNDGNKGVISVPQISSISGASLLRGQ